MALLWLHALMLTPAGAITGHGVLHSASEAALVVVFAVLATYGRFPRRIRSAAASIGMLASSAVLVHFSGGYIEVHFHFFVMLVIITLYHDWVPLLLSLAFVVVHHGTLGLIDPTSVYNHAEAWAHPWTWAAIHGGFILAACAASVGHWHFTEAAQASAREADRRAYDDLASADTRVRASEARFRALIERSADGISLVDASGTVLYASPAAPLMSGFTAEEHIGENVLGRVHPDDAPRIRQRFAELVRMPGGTITDVFRRQKKDRSWYWIEATGTNLLHDPAVQAIVINYRDVTTRKRAEAEALEINDRLRVALAEVSEREAVIRGHAEQLTLLNEFAHAVSGTLDQHSVFALITRQVSTLVGSARCSVSQYEPENGGFRLIAVHPQPPEGQSGIPGMQVGALIKGDGAFLGAVRRGGVTIAAPESVESAERPIRLAAAHGLNSIAAVPVTIGGVLWGTLNVGFSDPGGATPERVEFLEAIASHLGVVIKNAQLYTDLRTAHQDLRRTQAQVVQQERLRALGQMASGIAHDFNNALSPVVGFSELLLDHPEHLQDAAKAQRLMRLIHTGALDAASVVERLREVYRQRDDDEPLTTVSLPQLVDQVIALTQPKWKAEAQRDGRTIVIETDYQPVPLVGGRETELREALTNLIFNAVDAMPGGGTITLRTTATDQHAVLEVADSGVGMAEERRRRCLEPFFTSKGERGTGLGLAMVDGVVQRHGGTLAIDSELGHGTTVRIGLPVAMPASAQVEVPADSPGQPLRVLVVDDEPAVRQVVVAYLKADGHTVESAASGREALYLFQPGLFDVVLTDRAMPELGGDQLAQALKALDPHIPVILMTGFGDLMIANGERPPGVDVILGKPITRHKMAQALASSLASAVLC